MVMLRLSAFNELLDWVTSVSSVVQLHSVAACHLVLQIMLVYMLMRPILIVVLRCTIARYDPMEVAGRWLVVYFQVLVLVSTVIDNYIECLMC